MRDQTLRGDLCIAGGGIAGVCAALAAARNGVRVILIQDRSVLGGNASSEIRMHIVGASCSGKRPGARESGIIDELRVEDAVRNPRRSAHLFDLMLYDKVVSEPNITLLLDTDCVGCERDGNRIAAVLAVRNLTEDRFRIEAQWFADCTGDGRLGVEAGAAFRMGREGRDEFGESLAPPEADRAMLGSSILFTARRHDRPMPFTAPSWARRFTEDDLRLRSHAELDYGYWWVEWGGHLDTIADNDRIRHELLRIALGVWDHVKNRCTPQGGIGAEIYDKASEGDVITREDAANWALDWIGFLPGKRESRRFIGLHTLTQSDVQSGRVFEDQVAYGGWWIDMHPVMGVDAVAEYPTRQERVPHVYSIPLRCLVARDIENLLFAGRNISATHIAFASTRVMATCAVVGQAAGTAVSIATRNGIRTAGDLITLPWVQKIQQRLANDGAFLIRSNVPEPGVEAIASSETPGGEATLVLNGIKRATSSSLHPLLPDSSNCWISADLPAWIELRFADPRPVRRVTLTFDTGFQRELTLTMSDAYAAKMIRGPQPETVEDYTLTLSGESTETIRVEGNYQGRRVHDIDRVVAVHTVRLDVHATNGAREARVFAIEAGGCEPPVVS